jgi:mannose-6-phosphate isomerase-like protein (cupin superfamily)
LKHYNINELQEFSTEKRVRKTLSKDGSLSVDVVFYEPGQGSPEHHHKLQDEVFHVLSGEGTMIIDGKEVAVREKDIILVPANTTHGIQNNGSGRLAVLFIKNSPVKS